MEIVTEQYKKTYNGEFEAKIYNCSGLNNCSKEFLQFIKNTWEGEQNIRKNAEIIYLRSITSYVLF